MPCSLHPVSPVFSALLEILRPRKTSGCRGLESVALVADARCLGDVRALYLNDSVSPSHNNYSLYVWLTAKPAPSFPLSLRRGRTRHHCIFDKTTVLHLSSSCVLLHNSFYITCHRLRCMYSQPCLVPRIIITISRSNIAVPSHMPFARTCP